MVCIFDVFNSVKTKIFFFVLTIEYLLFLGACRLASFLAKVVEHRNP